MSVDLWLERWQINSRWKSEITIPRGTARKNKAWKSFLGKDLEAHRFQVS